MTQERIAYLDLIRVVAAVMVVMIHTCGTLLLETDTHSFSSLLYTIVSTASSCAVPLFFMISGCLILSPSYQISVKKIIHKVLKIILIFLIWSFVYALIYTRPQSIEKIIIHTIKGPFHFWFFEYLIGIYLLIPLFKGLTELNGGKFIPWFLLCWSFFACLIFTVNGTKWHNAEIHVLTSKVFFETCGFSGYFVLGYWLNDIKKQFKTIDLALVFISCVIVQAAVSRYDILEISTYSFTPTVLVESCAVFLICKQSSLASGKTTRFLSSITLGIYIIHPLIIDFLTKAINVPLMHTALLLPTVVILSAFCSWILSYYDFRRHPSV